MTNPADLSSFQNGQVPVAGQQVNTASTYSGSSSNNILLQTAEANILNLNQKNTAKSFIAFVCNAKRFAIAFLFFSSSFFLSRQCFWTDWRKFFSNFCSIAALSACDQYRG